MTMGRTVALAAAMVLMSAAAGRADDLSDVEDDVPDPAPVATPEPVPQEIPESAPVIEPPDYARDGIYVGLGGSYGIETFEDSASNDISRQLSTLGYANLPLDVDVDGTMGMNGQIGYRFHPHFSIESQFEWLDGFDGDVSDVTMPVGEFADVSIEPWVITLSLKAHLLTGRYQPYVSAGGGVYTLQVKLTDVGGMRVSNTERINDFTGRFGGGVDVYVTENFLMTMGLSYVLPNGEASDYDYLSFTWGIGYRF